MGEEEGKEGEGECMATVEIRLMRITSA